jgi:hypothetical protein
MNTARYHNMSNTTRFHGPDHGVINIVNTTTHNVVSFFNWVIDKETPDATITLVSEGRTPSYTAPIVGPVAIQNALVVQQGILDYNEFPVVLGFSTFVENHGTIGLMNDPGFLLFQGSQNQLLKIPAQGDPYFGQLFIDNQHGVTLQGKANLNVGNLKMRRGILHIGTEKLVLHGSLENIATTGFTTFGADKMIRTAGRHSDGGLVRRITGTGQYLYPLGTNRDNNNRYTPAHPSFHNVTDTGFVQINNVGHELATLYPESNRGALQYYWRVRFSNFENIPEVSHQFTFIPGDVTNLNNNQREAGKVVNLTRYCCTIGSVNNNSNLILFNQTILEPGEFTMAHKDRFQGNVRVYYTRDHGNSTGITAREPHWTDHRTWTRADLSGFDPAQPHRSNNPAVPNGVYPGPGDIVVIGWVPWDDPKTNLRGQPHGVWVDNNHQYAAEVRFTQMLDPDGNPTPRVYRSNFQFRPTLCINNTGGQLSVAVVSGEGMFWNRMNSQPNFEAMDIREFAEQDSSYVLYENFQSNFTYGNTPPLFPNLMISNDGWGSNNHNITFTNNIATTGNFEVLGNINLLLNSGETGDFHIGRDLIMFEFQGSEGGASGGGAEISFNHTGTQRRFIVEGDLIMRNRGSHIHVRQAGSGDNLLHQLEVHGNIMQESAGANPNGLLFYTAHNRPRIALTLGGNKDGAFEVISGTTPNLYNLMVDKGGHSAFLNTLFVLNSSANALNKPLELLSGTAVINHPALDLLVNTGGASFPIPAGATLELQQGQIRITGEDTGMALNGTLRLRNETAALIESPGNNNFIQVGASGQATLEVHDQAILRVGSQVRNPINSDQGALRYRQYGGQVFLATQTAPETSRGVLEIQNSGSEFIFTGGDLTIVQAHGSFPAREPLFLKPAFASVSPAAVIHIGHDNTPPNQIIELYSEAPLPSLHVNHTNTARATATNSLRITGALRIGAGNSFSADGHNLTLEGDLHNQGNPQLFADTVFFAGNTQQVSGHTIFNRLVVNAAEEVILENNNALWEVQQNFHLFGGILIDGGNPIDVHANIFNQAMHSSSDPETGGMRLRGSTLQNIYGNGTFGRIELDNSAGARIHGPMRLDNHLTLTNGLFRIGSFRLTMGPQAQILGGDFGPNRMILTNGIFEDRGIRKHVNPGSGAFTFPFGANGKFNPALLQWAANAGAGTVDITPVDSRHMTFTGDTVLRYYWYVESAGLSSFSGRMAFKYNPSEVEGDDAEYMAARLLNHEWTKFPTEYVDHVNDSIFFEFTGTNTVNGEYTAGLDDNIPENVPLLISNNNGTWVDENNWIRWDGGEVPVGGPNGHRVLILEQHTITIHHDQRATYQMELRGRLEAEETIMHNFGTLTGTGTLALHTGVLPAGRLDAFFTCAGGTMEYGGPHDIHISPRYTTFRNLTLTGSGRRTLPAASVLVCNDLKVLQQAAMTATYTITLMGNFTLEKTATTDFYNNFIMAGLNPQYVFGDVTDSNAFHNLELNNANGIHFMGSAEVDGVLHLRNGTAFMDDNHYLQLNNIYGLNFTPNVQRDNFVQGRLIRRLSPGGGQNIFPVGRNGKMRSLFVTAPATTTARYWDVNYFDHSASLEGMNTAMFNAPLLNVSDAEYWVVAGPGNSSARIGLSWGPESGVDHETLEGLSVAKWNHSAWEDKSQAAAIITAGTTGTIHSEFTSSFSTRYFTIASRDPDDPLPIELLSFTARPDNEAVRLDWVTASEINNDFFTIERSRDGIHFEPVEYIQSLAPGGHSTQNLYYHTWDHNPLDGRSYYRLKQTDFDSSYEYSPMVQVLMIQQLDAAFTLFPNPNSGSGFHVALHGLSPFEDLRLTITALSGRVAFTRELQAGHDGSLYQQLSPPAGLPRGVYIVTVAGPSGRFNQRMVVH